MPHSLAKVLAKYNQDVKLHVIKFTDIQTAIYQNCPHEYLITIMRRMMYRIAERISRMNNCKIVVNGESIGQVASQTLNSMNVINEVVKIPVIRPVACFDKLEIIDIAKKIDTYETSILPFEDCCTVFVPEHPVINPTFENAREYQDAVSHENNLIVEKLIHSKRYLNEGFLNCPAEDIFMENLLPLQKLILALYRNGTAQDCFYYVDDTFSDKYLLKALTLRIIDMMLYEARKKTIKKYFLL